MSDIELKTQTQGQDDGKNGVEDCPPVLEDGLIAEEERPKRTVIQISAIMSALYVRDSENEAQSYPR
jgi:hypothetical protein